MKSALLTAALAFAALPAAAQTSPEGVAIRSISYAGSGCPAGSVTQWVSRDAGTLMLMFLNYAIDAIGPGIPLSYLRRNCQVAVDLAYPDGWSYALAGLTYRGFDADFDAGVALSLVSRSYFQRTPATTVFTAAVYGPLRSSADIVAAGDGVLNWSPCHLTPALNVNQSMLMSTSNRRAARGSFSQHLETGPMYGEVVHELVWKRCP
jgi:hypothetical protein